MIRKMEITGGLTLGQLEMKLDVCSKEMKIWSSLSRISLGPLSELPYSVSSYLDKLDRLKVKFVFAK